MVPATQVKLLRVLQERTFRRLGGRAGAVGRRPGHRRHEPRSAEAVRDGKLREDLYYRLNVFTIELPPLRERQGRHPAARADVPERVQHARNGKSVRAVDQEAMHLLEHYPWPGNIRELRNVIERATILAEGDFIEPRTCRRRSSSPAARRRCRPLTIAPGTTVDEAERRLILLTLEHTRNNKTRAAEILGISLKTLHNKLNRMKEDGERGVQRVAGERRARTATALGRGAGSTEAVAPVPSIKAKQVAGVTTLVGVVVVAVHDRRIPSGDARASASRRRVARRSSRDAIFHARRQGRAPGRLTDPYTALREDGGLRSILDEHHQLSDPETSPTRRSSNPNGHRRGAQLPTRGGQRDARAGRLSRSSARVGARAAQGGLFRATFEIPRADPRWRRAVRRDPDRRLDRCWSARAQDALKTAAQAVLARDRLSMLVAMVLAQWMLRPIHVIQSGLEPAGTRRARRHARPAGARSSRDLGTSFEAVSAQLLAPFARGAAAPGHRVRVGDGEPRGRRGALLAPRGELIFTNAAMRGVAGAFESAGSIALPAPSGRQLVERTLAGRKSQGPVSIDAPADAADSSERC